MSRFYTEVSLNDEWEGKLPVYEWQSGVYIPPLQYLETHHLPAMPLARSLPPAGRFATMSDITGEDFDVRAPSMTTLPFTPIGAAAALLAAFYLFLPVAV